MIFHVIPQYVNLTSSNGCPENSAEPYAVLCTSLGRLHDDWMREWKFRGLYPGVGSTTLLMNRPGRLWANCMHICIRRCIHTYLCMYVFIYVFMYIICRKYNMTRMIAEGYVHNQQMCCNIDKS